MQLSVPTSVAAGATATFLATLTPVPGSNPETTLTWSLSGTGCSGASCGTLAVITIQSAGGNVTATTASYTAPLAAPTPDSVTVTGRNSTTDGGWPILQSCVVPPVSVSFTLRPGP